jgi:tight adherence protein B
MLVKFLFFSLLFYLVLSLPVPRKPGVSVQLKRAVEKIAGRRKRTVFQGVSDAIRVSGVRRFVPVMDVPLFLLLSLIFFLAGCLWGFQTTRSPVVSLAAGVMAGFLPRIALEFMAVLNSRKVRSLYLGFLNVFYGFYSLDGDIVGAFRRSAAYTGEPLRTFINKMVHVYDRGGSDFGRCLDELAREVRDREFVKFIKFTKLYLVYGGDYARALEKLADQARRLESAGTALFSSATVGFLAVSAMAVLNGAGLVAAYALNPDTAFFVKNTLTGQFLALANLGAVAFGLYTAVNIFGRR